MRLVDICVMLMILYIEYILKWWLVINTKGSFEITRLNDWRRSPTWSRDDWQIRFLRDEVPPFATFLRKLKTGKRCKKLTIDTLML